MDDYVNGGFGWSITDDGLADNPIFLDNNETPFTFVNIYLLLKHCVPIWNTFLLDFEGEYTASRDCTLFLVDCTQSMFHQPDKSQPNLFQKCMQVINHVDKFFNKSNMTMLL